MGCSDSNNAEFHHGSRRCQGVTVGFNLILHVCLQRLLTLRSLIRAQKHMHSWELSACQHVCLLTLSSVMCEHKQTARDKHTDARRAKFREGCVAVNMRL